MNAIEVRKLLYEMVATNKSPRRHYKRFIGDIMTEDYGCYILEQYHEEYYIFNPSQTAFNYEIVKDLWDYVGNKRPFLITPRLEIFRAEPLFYGSEEKAFDKRTCARYYKYLTGKAFIDNNVASLPPVVCDYKNYKVKDYNILIYRIGESLHRIYQPFTKAGTNFIRMLIGRTFTTKYGKFYLGNLPMTFPFYYSTSNKLIFRNTEQVLTK